MASPTKKVCTSEKDVFERFAEEPKRLEQLKSAFKMLSSSNVGLLETLTIRKCNADYFHGSEKYGTGKPFSRADVEVTENFDEDDKLFYFGSLFLHGYKLLKKYLKNPKEVPSQNPMKLVLSKLLTYLLDKDEQNRLKSINDGISTKCDLAVRFAEHLFSKLCCSTAYKLDQSYSCNMGQTACLCGCGTSVRNRFTDTSIGNKIVWHGCLDIILGGNSPPVIVFETEPISVVEEFVQIHFGKDVEIHFGKDLEDPDVTSQLLAQTIVFSFTQKTNHPESTNFLIPTIAVSQGNIIFYFYDSENDILLKSMQFPIFAGNEISSLAILAIWFVVNYQFLCSGCTEEILFDAKKANFFQAAGSRLSVYQKELSLVGITSDEGSTAIVHYAPHILLNPQMGKSPVELLNEDAEDNT